MGIIEERRKIRIDLLSPQFLTPRINQIDAGRKVCEFKVLINRTWPSTASGFRRTNNSDRFRPKKMFS